MERIKLEIHFSYIIAVIVAVLLGRLVLLAIYTITMVLHEVAHYLVARRMFYQCTKLQITAFGAVLYGEFDNAVGWDQVVIAMAGPIANMVICIILVALWWVFPTTYSYTDELVLSNFAMAVVNLLPSYPMDGGRVLLGILQHKGHGSITVAKNITLVVALALLVVFLVSVFYGVALYNVALLSLLMCCGYCVDNDGMCYVRLSQLQILHRRLGLGVEKKTLVFGIDTHWSKVIIRLRGHYLYNIEVTDQCQVVAVIDYVMLDQLIKNCPPNKALGDIVSNIL